MTSIEAQAKQHEENARQFFADSADRAPKPKVETAAPLGLATLDLYVPKALRTKSPGFVRPIMIDGSILLDDKSCKPKMEVYAQGPATDFLHATTGGLTEIGGEFCDQLKAHLFYGKPLDYVNLGEELGDSWWYIAVMLNATDTPLSVMQEVIDEAVATVVESSDYIDAPAVAPIELLMHANYIAKQWSLLNEMAINDFQIDPTAKVFIHGHPELERVMFEIVGQTAALGALMGHHLPLVWQSNIAKLYKRYPDKFDSTDAQFRNLAVERESLEANHDAAVNYDGESEPLSRVNLKTFLEQQDGKFVGVDFIKKDGSDRSLNGRLGVVKFLKGGDNTTEALDRSYLTVYDMKARGYRNVDLASTSRVRANGRQYVITD